MTTISINDNSITDLNNDDVYANSHTISRKTVFTLNCNVVVRFRVEQISCLYSTTYKTATKMLFLRQSFCVT